jgi:RNA polymerase sigma-70 factor (ECF subfamily)
MAVENRTRAGPEQRAAFLALLGRVEAELIGFVCRRVGSRHQAENIVQETLLRAWRHPAFDPARPDARSCLFTIATNLIRDWLGCSGSRLLSLEELSSSTCRPASKESLAPLLIDQRADDPLGRLIASETTEAVHAALARLAPEHRDVLERFYLRQEGTQFAIAAALGISVAAFNSRLNRARKELKQALLGPPSSEDEQWSAHGPR